MSLASGMTRGVVTRATSAGVYVQIPSLYGTAELGPLDAIVPRMRRPSRSTSSAGAHTHAGAVGSDGAHTHTLAEVDTNADRFAAGDRVLVAAVDAGDWIVLGRIGTGVNA